MPSRCLTGSLLCGGAISGLRRQCFLPLVLLVYSSAVVPTGIFLGNSALDIHLHDTYFVVAHFHIVMGVASFFGMFAGIYHWYPKMYGRYLNNTLGYIRLGDHYRCLSYLLAKCTMKVWQECQGVIMIFQVGNSFNMFGGLNEFISTVALIVFATQLLFVFNFFHSTWKGRK